MKRILLIVFLLFSFKCFSAPTNTMDISPAAVGGAIIQADDENSRNNEISTKYNAHSHTDIISSVSNDWQIGDGQAGDKYFSVDNGDLNIPSLRFNDTSDIWQLTNNGVNFYELILGDTDQTIAGEKTFSDLVATTADIDGGSVNSLSSFGMTTVDDIDDILDEDAMGSNSATALATQQSIKAYIDARLPSGTIVLWSGAISAIPAGWVICDGNNSTPNLTDRFVLHADADSAGTNDVGATGGSKTISISNLPAHDHGISDGVAAGALGGTIPRVFTGTSDLSSSTGGGTDYMPRFYSLAYIMKT